MDERTVLTFGNIIGFANECDGDWEHENQVKIETVDNPGWHTDRSSVNDLS